MLADPNLIKRPLIVNDTKKPYLGFDADTLKAYLKN
jgi:arsenate reductase-like glutaredoxin family protein